VTVSIGVSEWHRDDDQDSWLKHADDALYLAKEMGRDRVVHRTGLYLLKPSRHD
jgi:PleD family two-component response regulator